MASEEEQLSSFQRECLQMVEEALGRRGFSGTSKTSGVHENYIVLLVRATDPALEIYIYNDEAGFFQGKKWRIWETQDFPEPEKLKEAFLAALTDALDALASR